MWCSEGFAPEAVKERMEVSRAKALITVDGARRKGKTAPVKATVDEVMGDLKSLEHIVVVRHSGIDVPMGDGRDVFYDEIVDAGRSGLPGRADGGRAPVVHPLLVGSTAKPKGIVHTTGGYLTGVSATHRYVFDLDPERDVYFCSADVGWITGHSYIVYGPLANGATVGDVRGRSRLPAQADLVGADRPLRREHLLHRSDRDPRVHEMGC